MDSLWAQAQMFGNLAGWYAANLSRFSASARLESLFVHSQTFFLISGEPLLDQESYTKSPIESLNRSLEAPGLENRLLHNTTLAKEDVEATASLLRSLLAADPLLRPSPNDLLEIKWVQQGDICTCGWCQADMDIVEN